MPKYSFEMKMEIVKAYLNGEGSYMHSASKYGIPDKKTVRKWLPVLLRGMFQWQESFLTNFSLSSKDSPYSSRNL